MRLDRLTRWQALGTAALLLLCAVLLSRALWFDPAVPYLSRGFGAPWVTVPMALGTDAIGVDPDKAVEFEFSRRFRLDEASADATLRLRANRRFSLSLDGAVLARSDGSDWKRDREIAMPPLRAGTHRLLVAVANPTGPPALQLRLSAPGAAGPTQAPLLIESGTGFGVVTPGRRDPVSAVEARDSKLYAPAFLLATPLALLSLRWPWLLAAACVGAFAAWRVRRDLATPARAARAPAFCLGAATLFWLLLFFFPFGQLPVRMGFDIPAHLLYIDFLREQRALPLASDGWSSYHPPLYHLLTALWVSVTGVGREGYGAALSYRSVGFAAGLSTVWSSYFLARRVFENDPLRVSLAVLATALLPMNIYMAAYVSNEALHAALVGAAVVAGAAVIAGSDGALRWRGGVGALTLALAAAVLTKYTALLVVPVLVFFVGFAAWLVRGESLGRALRRSALVLGGVAALGGWFYARNYWYFGDPLVWNLDVPGALSWWMQPGYHTADYYLRFGEALRHPYFAGFASFWDGVYSTLWGDGLAAGMVRLETRHGVWNEEAMTLTYLFALPATLLGAAGVVVTLARAFRSDAPAERRMIDSLLVALVFCLGFALAMATLRLPFYAQSKAFYALAAVVPLAPLAAEGLALPYRARVPWIDALYSGYLASLAALLVTSFLG